MSPEDLKQIEALIEKHKPAGPGFLTFLFLMFLLGLFKGCGY